MKKGLNKFAKGMFAIFTIKLLLFGGVFIIQSCQTDSDELFENTNKTLALDEFKNLLIKTSPNVQNVIETQRLTMGYEKKNNTNIQTTYEEDVKESLKPLVKGSLVLLKEYGIEDKDLLDNFGNLNNPNIAILALFTYRNETLRNNNSQVVKNNSLFNYFGTNAYAQSTLDVVDCALTALGLPAGLVIGSAEKLTTKVLLKTAAKLAGRAIGWIALGVSVYQFARCVQNLPKAEVAATYQILLPINHRMNNNNNSKLWKRLT